jgi:hypothetical protein
MLADEKDACLNRWTWSVANSSAGWPVSCMGATGKNDRVVEKKRIRVILVI